MPFIIVNLLINLLIIYFYNPFAVSVRLHWNEQTIYYSCGLFAKEERNKQGTSMLPRRRIYFILFIQMQ